MDLSTGEIISSEKFGELSKHFPERANKDFIQIDGNKEQKCPCGSGEKFSNCCFSKFSDMPRREKRASIRKFFKNPKK